MSIIKKLITILSLITLTLITREIQTDKVDANVYKISISMEDMSKTITFQTSNGNLYDYKTNNVYKVGQHVTLKMFDLEDCNPKNDIIVEIVNG